MNTENINKIIDLIKQEDINFNMNAYGFNKGEEWNHKPKNIYLCGTPACIGGWIMRITNEQNTSCMIKATMDFFDVERSIAHEICYPYVSSNYIIENHNLNYHLITKQQAIEALETVRDYGPDLSPVDIWNYIHDE